MAKNNLVDAKTGLVWDNIEQNEAGVVTTKKEWVFTYNMGTWIGAGVMLYKVTNDRAYLSDALKSAKTLTTSPNLTSGGLLRDEGQGDGGLFKGILVRYYTDLIQEPTINSTDRSMLVRFLRFNAETFYRRGINRPAMLAGPNWGTKPTERTDLTTQLSAVMLIEAAAKLDEEGLLK
jgi:predicted alpha-1,6-mannanase (GH76 family)